MVGARGFESPTLLLLKYGCSLLILILIVLTVTLIVYCVTKSQEAPILLEEILSGVLYVNRSPVDTIYI